MTNDTKSRYIYFQDTTVLDSLPETLDWYDQQNGSSPMTNDTKD